MNAPVSVGNLNTNHDHVVINQLITQALLGIDFLYTHKLFLDFTSMPSGIIKSARPIIEARNMAQASVCAINLPGCSSDDEVEDI